MPEGRPASASTPSDEQSEPGGWPSGVWDPARSQPVPSDYTALIRLLHLCPSNNASPSLPHRRKRESGAPAVPRLAKIGGCGERCLAHSQETGSKQGRYGGTEAGGKSEDDCLPLAGPCGVARAGSSAAQLQQVAQAALALLGGEVLALGECGAAEYGLGLGPCHTLAIQLQLGVLGQICSAHTARARGDSRVTGPWSYQ